MITVYLAYGDFTHCFLVYHQKQPECPSSSRALAFLQFFFSAFRILLGLEDVLDMADVNSHLRVHLSLHISLDTKICRYVDTHNSSNRDYILP